MIGKILKKFAPHPGRWIGIPEFKMGVQSIRNTGLTKFKQRKKLLDQNLKKNKHIEDSEFERILLLWGIEDENGLKNAMRTKIWERRVGILITLISSAVSVWQIFLENQGPLWRTLLILTCLSILLAGLCLWLTSSWRLSVFASGKFVPFLRWLRFWGGSSASPR